MGLSFDSIPEDKIEWIRKQEVFWVATSPLSGDGHVNVSPKGLRGSFVVEGPNEGERVVSDRSHGKLTDGAQKSGMKTLQGLVRK